MTRLDQAGEPSMEEILASIRRIIAEDPPGSRPATDSPPAAAPSGVGASAARAKELAKDFAKDIARDAFAADASNASGKSPGKSASQPSGQPSGPFAGATSQEPLQAPGMTREPSFSLPSGTSGAGTPGENSSLAPSFIPSLTMPSATVSPAPLPNAAAFDIDAQLADVLGAARAAQKAQHAGAPAESVPPQSGPPSTASVQAAIDSIMSVKPSTGGMTMPPPAPPQRAGFTVARDGYIPGLPSGEPATSADQRAAADPFEFTLGPSPFARASAPLTDRAADHPGAGRPSDFQDLGTLVPSRHAPPARIEAVEDERMIEAARVAKAEAEAAEAARVAKAEAEAAEAARVAMAEAEAAEAARVAMAEAEAAEAARVAMAEAEAAEAARVAMAEAEAAEAARVAMAEAEAAEAARVAMAEAEAAEAERAANAVLERIANKAAGQATGQTAGAPPSDIQLHEEFATELEKIEHDLAAQDRTAQDLAEVHAMPQMGALALRPIAGATTSQNDLSENSTPQPYATNGDSGLPATRTMEDTVAELLRPMLKNWLAENMPKIVERALRKELDDSNRSEHKTAAE